MNPPLAFLDVNVPMYAAGTDHPYKEACVWLMLEIAEGNLSVAIDTEIIQEVLYRFGALKRWQTATTMATSLLELIPSVFAITPVDMKTAVALFAQYGPEGIQARDVIHVAVMFNHGLERIISIDKHFDQIAGIDRLDPLMMFNER